MSETAHHAAPAALAPSDIKATLKSSIIHKAGTALVLLTLGALAFAGHHTGWTLPAFSALLGNGSDARDDWCAAHAVPESQCVECNPRLLPRPADYGWCPRHGVHACPLEHPDVAQLATVPQVSPADLARAQRALDLGARPENSRLCKLYQRRVQFASQEAFERSGVEVEPVWRAPVVESVAANGELTYDPTRVARVSARVPGTVWRVEKNVGDSVRQGEVIALVEAAEVGRAKAEFLQAAAQLRLRETNFQQLHGLAGSGAVSERTVREAETGLSEARIRLLGARQALVNLGLPVAADEVKGLSEEQLAAFVQFLGLPDGLRQALDPRTTTANLLPVRSPLDGTLVAREVVASEVVDTTRVLAVVADVRRLWLTLSVRQEDTRKLAPGQPVHFRSDAGGEEVTTAVTWISPAVDERTRTVKVRADVANPAGRLRANTFGKGQIVLREEKDAIVVPSAAVHWEGDCHVVFVRDRNFLAENGFKVFHTRTVRLGVKDERNAEILAGVLPGEIVATRGSGVLRAELLKGNLGEG
jgi:cobalt-zinc-cadmium efflux system membrane fusion protein